MEEIKFIVSHCNVGISNIKEAEANILVESILGKLDISELVSFSGFGIITFNNSRGDDWTVSLQNKYIRGKINCIIFNVIENEKNNPYNYKQLIVFQNLTKSLDSYGYVWVKNNEKSLLRICLDHLSDEVVKHLAADLNSWKMHYIYDAYNSSQKLNAVEFDNIYKKHIETYKCDSYDAWKDSLKKYNQRYKIA